MHDLNYHLPMQKLSWPSKIGWFPLGGGQGRDRVEGSVGRKMEERKEGPCGNEIVVKFVRVEVADELSGPAPHQP
jgi:hypothetical protein